MTAKKNPYENLPPRVGEYITLVLRKMGYTREARGEVRQELIDHFEDALRELQTPQDRAAAGDRLIAEFGDPKVLARLIRRGKKRCRPLWKKAIVRSLQAFGVFLLVLVLYTVWFFLGRPVRSTNYLAVANQLAQPKAPESQNAWPHYAKASELLTTPKETEDLALEFAAGKLGGYAELTSKQKGMISTWVRENEKAWGEFAAASRMPYCWFELKTAQNDPDGLLYSTIMPGLGKVRQIGRIGVCRAQIAMADGHAEQAIADCLAVARAGTNFRNPNSTLIQQLVGMALGDLAFNATLLLMKENTIPPASLAQAQEQLEAMCAEGFPAIGLELERLTFLDMVQFCYTEGGPGGGHLIPGNVIEVMESKNQDVVLAYLAALVQAGRDETVRMGQEYYRRVEKESKLTPFQRMTSLKEDETGESLLLSVSRTRYVFLRALMPAFNRLATMSSENKATWEATITVLALQRFKAQQGRYPAGLDELRKKMPHTDISPIEKDPDINKLGSLFTVNAIVNYIASKVG